MSNQATRNVVVVSHRFVTQLADELVVFLNSKKCENVLHIRHSFSDATDRCSYCTWYKKGNIYKTYKTKDYKSWPELIIYAKEYFFTVMRVLFSRVKYYRYFGMDGLCVMFGRSLRRLHRVEKIIFYAIDFVPADRFGNTVKDKIYHWVNINSYKKSDEMWDLSPRMAEAREKYLNVMEKDYKLHRVVEHGMWPNRVKKCSYEECKKNTLVFMGHLVEKQGVQLVIRSIPEIIKKIPEFRFKIIGGGSYSKELIKLAESEHVEKYCQFLGKIENIETVEHEIAISCVAIAPYIRALDTFTYYADPGKVKTYLACGVPVLLTDIPWNAKEIEDNLCGKIIDENTASVVDAVAFLMNEAINKKFRINAIAYSHKFDYGKVLADLI